MDSQSSVTPNDAGSMKKEIRRCIASILESIPGEDWGREGLQDTPERVAKMYEELFSGYNHDGRELLERTFDDDEVQKYSGMVIVKDIPFYSLCEHHMVPFFGKVSIGYLPDGIVVGLSKLARLVQIYARRLQVQERMTDQIANDIVKYLRCKGVMVIVEAEHLCMSMRGAKSQGTRTTTSSVKGAFETDGLARQEFLAIVRS